MGIQAAYMGVDEATLDRFAKTSPEDLADAVVGVHVFECEEFIGCTEADELPAVIAALDALVIDELLAAADFAQFRKAKLYPKIWTDEPAQLKSELAEAFQALRAFLHECAAAKRHVIVSIL